MNNIKKHKRLIAAIVVILLAVLVEIFANRSAWGHAYDLDITDHMYISESAGQEEYQVIFSAPKGLYIQMLHVQGHFKDEEFYDIETKEINDFGKETEQKYHDCVNKLLPEYSTSINKKVTYLKMTMKKNKDAELTKVSLSNKADINLYRYFFILLIGMMIYCTFFEKEFIKKTEWYFAVFALSFGMLIIAAAQPTCNSWDEQIHFRDSYRIASGHNVEWTEAGLNIMNRINPKCNTKEEYKLLKAYMDEHGTEVVMKETQETLGISYDKIAYIPMAVFLFIGKNLKLPFSAVFALGKFGNLLMYVIVMFWAIRLAKSRKLLLAFVAMLPTPLFLASSYTYDSVVFSFITLGCVLWSREAFFQSTKYYHTASVIGAIFMMSVGCLSKAVYIPLVLLMLLLPQFYKKNKKEKILFLIGIGVLFLVVMATFVLPVISNTVSGNIAYGGDSRGGDTSVVRQLVSMVKHPLASIRLMFGSIFQLDNFRNLGNIDSDNYFFGNLMFLNYASRGTLADKWSILLLPMLTLLVFQKEKGSSRLANCEIWKRILMWGIFLITVMLIWSAMYLSFTPVGEASIAGVQARYYLPLIYLGALLLSNSKIKVEISKYGLAKLSFIVANILQIAAVWELLLQGRLI